MIDVILETGEDRRKMIRTATERLGADFVERIKEAKTIFIKVNLIHHERQLASTHVDAVRGLLDVITLHSPAIIYIGDAGYTGTKAAFRHFGYDRIPEEYPQVQLMDLNDDGWIPGVSIKKDGSKNEIRRAKTPLEADIKISLAPMKTHASVGASLSIENWVMGTWIVPPRIGPTGQVFAKWPWLEEEGAWAHHASIARIFKDAPCDISIIDGIMAMEGDGPIEGAAIPMNVVLAGFDPIAVDTVAASLMGIDSSDIGYLTMLAEQNIGTIDMTRINVPPMLLLELKREVALPDETRAALRAFKNLDPSITVSL